MRFFYRKNTPKLAWIVGILCLATTLLCEWFIPVHAHFNPADFFSFNALYGLLSCIVMVLLAKCLDIIIKRPENYYDE